MPTGTDPLLENRDVVVIGAGAAGLLAAARAAERGRSTMLLEKNRKPGVKILMSGGTRCNLTHNTDARGIIKAYGVQGRFLSFALAALGPRDVVNLVEAEGVPTKIEPGGKIFPVSNRATDVLDALMKRFQRSGAVLALEEPLREVARDGPSFLLTTAKRTLRADKIIITVGGQSYPGSGTAGDGYAWARHFEHTVVPPRPALVPLAVQLPWVRELLGITVPDVRVRLQDPEGAVLDERRGSFLFTHFGLSGPVVLDVSREVTGHPRPGKLVLVCDFLPDMSAEELDRHVREAIAASGKKPLGKLLPDALPVRLRETLVVQAGLTPDRPGAELRQDERLRLIQAVKETRIALSGALGFEKAEVTAGGVALNEVDPRTMQSQRVPNLYFAGEVLDLDGPIGGYNFQAAFSTGWLAGESV